jgi:hypothetical protein
MFVLSNYSKGGFITKHLKEYKAFKKKKKNKKKPKFGILVKGRDVTVIPVCTYEISVCMNFI